VAQVDELKTLHAQRSAVLVASIQDSTQWQKHGEALGQKEKFIMKFAKRTNNTVLFAV